MFVPLPVLIAAGLLILVLAAMALRSTRKRDPLMGGAPHDYGARRPAPVAGISPATLPAGTLPAEVERQVRALLAAGRKIDAIKLARDATGLGLKETKDLVDAMERQAP